MSPPAQAFPDRRDKLFGRAPALEYLKARATYPGITAMVARPQMGKSWLLTELARSLSEGGERSHLVGFAPSLGKWPDSLLRAVVDLYTRCLSQASYLAQGKRVWDQQKGKLLSSVATALGGLFEKPDAVAEPVGYTVNKAFQGLVVANQALKSGVQLPPLQ